MKNKKIVDRISIIVSEYYNVSRHYMFQNNRKQDVADLRSIFHYMCARLTKETLSDIGKYSKIMGRNKAHDHASILHGKRKIEGLIQFDKKLRVEVNEIEEKILKVIDHESFKSKKKQKQINEIIDVVFEEEDENFIKLIHSFISKTYKNRSEENIKKYLNIINKIDDEGIHQATQNNIGLGVV